MQAAARYAISVAIIITIGQFLRLPNYYWGIITATVLLLPTAGAVISKGIFRLIGTFAAALISIWLVGLFTQHHIAFAIVYALLMGVLIYYALGKYAPYTFQVCAFTISIICINSFAQPTDVSWVAPTRAFEIAVGVLVVGFVTLTVWPKYARHDLRESYCTSLETLANMHECVWSALKERRPGREDFERLRQPARGGLLRRADLLELSIWENPGLEEIRGHFEMQNHFLSRLFGLVYQIEPMISDPPQEALHLEVRDEAERLNRAVAASVRKIASDVRALRLPRPDPDLQEAVEALKRRMHDPRLRERSFEFTTGSNMRSVTYLFILIESAEMIEKICEEFEESDCQEKGGHPFLPFLRILQGLKEETLKPDRLQCRKAILGAACLTFIYIVGQSGYFGAYLLTAVTAIIAITIPSVGGSIAKSVFMFVGILTGTVVSLLLLGVILPHVTTLFWLLVCTAPFFLAAGYVMGGSANASPLGIFTNVMIASTVFKHYASPPSITGISMVIFGVLAGAVLGTLAQLCFLSQSCHRQAVRNVATIQRLIRDRLNQLRSLYDMPPEQNIQTVTNLNHQSLQLISGLSELNTEARYELEPGAISKDKLEALKESLIRQLLSIISLEGVAYEHHDFTFLEATKQSGQALKLRCLDLLETLAAYTESGGKLPYPADELEGLRQDRARLEADIHAARALCQDHNISQRPFVASMSYLQLLDEFAMHLTETAGQLRDCLAQLPSPHHHTVLAA